MARLAEWKAQKVKAEEEARRAQEEASKPVKTDKRGLASKLWDTVNIADSGRSFTTDKPSEDAKKKSGGDQAKEFAGNLFGGMEKLGDSVEALTGVASRRQEQWKKELDEGKITREEYQKRLKGAMEDTKWAGDEDKGTGDRLKKSAGVAAQAVSEVIPVGKGAQAGKTLKEGAEEGLSRMAKMKAAGQIGAQGAAVGAVGGAGGSLAEDDTNLATDEGKLKVVGDALMGGLGGGVLAGAGAAVPFRKPLVGDQRGSIQAYKGIIGENLQQRIDEGKIDGKIATKNANDLKLGADTMGTDLDPVAVENYVTRIKNGDEIEPIVVKRGSDGADYVADGAHRLAAAKQLGIQDIPTVRQVNNVPLPDKLTPPTIESLSPARPQVMAAEANTGAVMEAPVQLRVLNDLQDEARLRSPGGEDVKPKQTTETQTQQGAQYIVDDINRINEEIGLELTPADRKVAGLLTGDGSTAQTRKGWKESTYNWLGKNFQDSTAYAAKTVGRPGVELVQDMMAGHKFKRDALEHMHDNMVKLAKLNKKLSGNAKRDIGARVGKALDDRENAQNYLKTDKEREMFDSYVQVFDYVKTMREKAGLETVENYRPWVNMKDAAEPPAWLAEGLTNSRVQTLSRFSKERVRDTPSDDVDNNLADMIYGYVNSQLNELAYDAPVRKFKGNFATMAAGNKANAANLDEGMKYLSTLVKQAVNPESKDAPERLVNKLASNVYGSVLPFNPKLTLMNKTQQWAANSFVSKGAVKVSKKLKNDLEQFEDGLVFGDSTVYGQLEDLNDVAKGGKKRFSEKVKKIDPYQRGETANVLTSYNKGLVQGAMDSDIYKAAVKSGTPKKDAVLQALADPDVRATAVKRGNLIVNDTQFGANPLARPGALRSEASLFGIPQKAFTMFTRFPIGMSQHILEGLNAKNARAAELLKGGDPRAMAVSEMRTNYKALLDVMKESRQAVKKDNIDIGVPEEVLDLQIKTISKNLKIIDNEAKKMSQMRTGKTMKNVAKMWTAAAAIQVIFDAGIQSFADDPTATAGEAAYKTNPTATGMIAGPNSKLGALTSSASPVDRQGGLNERALTNYIPGVGLAVNRGRDIQKLSESLMGEPEPEE